MSRDGSDSWIRRGIDANDRKQHSSALQVIQVRPAGKPKTQTDSATTFEQSYFPFSLASTNCLTLSLAVHSGYLPGTDQRVRRI